MTDCSCKTTIPAGNIHLSKTWVNVDENTAGGQIILGTPIPKGNGANDQQICFSADFFEVIEGDAKTFGIGPVDPFVSEAERLQAVVHVGGWKGQVLSPLLAVPIPDR